NYLHKTFFAPNHDPSNWLNGWYREVSSSQRKAALATKKEDWWYASDVPILDLQALDDPFRPHSSREAIRDELGDRVHIAIIENASHAVVVEQPERVVEEVLSWIKTL